MEQTELEFERNADQKFVVKSNELAEARGDWPKLDYRIFSVFVAQLDPREDTEFSAQSVRISTLQKLIGTDSRDYYSRAKDIAEQLTNRKLYLERPDDNAFEVINVFAACKYEDGVITAHFTDQILPHLLKLKRRFTAYQLQFIMKLGSRYSIRLYEILQRYAYRGEWEVSLDKLRKKLSLEDKYQSFSNFRRRVIERAESEINEKTDICFTYEKVTGAYNRVEGLRFQIWRNKDHQDSDTLPPEFFLLDEVEQKQIRERAERLVEDECASPSVLPERRWKKFVHGKIRQLVLERN